MCKTNEIFLLKKYVPNKLFKINKILSKHYQSIDSKRQIDTKKCYLLIFSPSQRAVKMALIC